MHPRVQPLRHLRVWGCSSLPDPNRDRVAGHDQWSGRGYRRQWCHRLPRSVGGGWWWCLRWWKTTGGILFLYSNHDPEFSCSCWPSLPSPAHPLSAQVLGQGPPGRLLLLPPRSPDPPLDQLPFQLTSLGQPLSLLLVSARVRPPAAGVLAKVPRPPVPATEVPLAGGRTEVKAF